jgi:hypothetical protein
VPRLPPHLVPRGVSHPLARDQGSLYVLGADEAQEHPRPVGARDGWLAGHRSCAGISVRRGRLQCGDCQQELGRWHENGCRDWRQVQGYSCVGISVRRVQGRGGAEPSEGDQEEPRDCGYIGEQCGAAGRRTFAAGRRRRDLPEDGRRQFDLVLLGELLRFENFSESFDENFKI